VTITFAGEAGPNGRGGHSVPKIELVSKLQALMHSGVLHMPDTLPLAKVVIPRGLVAEHTHS